MSLVSTGVPIPERAEDLVARFLYKAPVKPTAPVVPALPCTVEGAISVAAIKSLDGNALFLDEGEEITNNELRNLARKKDRKGITDVFPSEVVDKFMNACGPVPGGQHYWDVMVEAMATITTGKAWVYKPNQDAPTGRYFAEQLKVLRKAGREKVTVWEVDEIGTEFEEIL